jgi:hypothetical protein
MESYGVNLASGAMECRSCGCTMKTELLGSDSAQGATKGACGLSDKASRPLGKSSQDFPRSILKRPVEALEAAADESAGFVVCVDVEFTFFRRLDDFFCCELR